MRAPAPPRLLRAILLRAVAPELRDAVDGDLQELYVARRAERGAAAAALWYATETLSFVVRFTIDRVIGAVRGIAGGTAAPTALDLRLGARLLARTPGLAIVGGFGMAIAVAMGAAAHAVVNTYFYPSDLPLHEGDRIVGLVKFDRQLQAKDERLLHDFPVWQRELRSVVDLGAFRTVSRNLITETGQGQPIIVAEMTASGFRLARVAPLLGRPLLDDDELPGAPPVVVIGYDVWHARFGGDPSVIGRDIRIGRTSHTIVGVMPQGFAFPMNHDWWVPLRVQPVVPVEPATGPDIEVFGRLAPGATKEAARAELDVINQRLAAAGPPEVAHLEARVVPYTDIFYDSGGEGVKGPEAVLRYLIALLLVVVAMNVAALVYARTVTRSGEIAVRTALGATRGRIVAQLFAEAFVLSGLAAVVGLVIAASGLNLFDRALAEIVEGGVPFWIRPGLSTSTILYAFALAVLGAVIVGVFPALRATGTQLRETIGSLGSGGKARLGPTWTALIVMQIAITVAVLPVAMFKGMQSLQAAIRPSGFAAGEYLSTPFYFENDGDVSDAPVSPDSVRATMTALLARLAIEPGVTGATVTGTVPWGGGRGFIEVDGADASLQRVRVSVVDLSYFDLFHVPLLTGRTFGPADAALPMEDRPVIVNRSFATELLGDGAAIGRRVRYPGVDGEEKPWITIAGVVDDFPAGVTSPGEGITRTIYHLEQPGESGGGLLTVRLQGQSPEAFTPTLRQRATSIDPTLQLAKVRSLDAFYRDFQRESSQLALVIALVTGSVLLLSAAGVHALVSFTVSQRRREIGIRTALGATARRILQSILARASRQLAVGVVLGLAMAVGLDGLSGGELMRGNGVLLVPATAAFMLLVGLMAAAGPARRGLRVQPTEMLRAE